MLVRYLCPRDILFPDTWHRPLQSPLCCFPPHFHRDDNHDDDVVNIVDEVEESDDDDDNVNWPQQREVGFSSTGTERSNIGIKFVWDHNFVEIMFHLWLKLWLWETVNLNLVLLKLDQDLDI